MYLSPPIYEYAPCSLTTSHFVTRAAHPILLDFITLAIFYENYKLRSSSLRLTNLKEPSHCDDSNVAYQLLLLILTYLLTYFMEQDII